MPVSVQFSEMGPTFSVGGDQESFEESGTAYGSTTYADVDAAVRLLSPASVTSAATGRTLYRQTIDYEHNGLGVWKFTVPYGPHEPKNADDDPEAEFSFDIGTETTKITHSLETVGSYPEDAPDLKGAINWNGKDVDGVDIMIPKCSLSYKQIVADEDFDEDFRRDLSFLVGTVNDDDWNGYEAGEVLFTSVSGSFRFEGTDWELSFTFLISQNVTDLTIGEFTEIQKKGWEYLWVKNKKKMDGPSFVEVPEFVKVEKVYRDGDYSILPL